jgi:hypothetical protein
MYDGFYKMFVTYFSFFCHLELCESLASTSFGAAPIPSTTTPALDPFAAGPSSQSQPFGRG